MSKAEKSACAGAESRLNLDDVLRELGQFGRYHLYNYLLIALAVFGAAFYGINYVFLAGDVAYRCVVPECEPQNSTRYEQSWLALALPPPVEGRAHSCSRYVPRPPLGGAGACANDSFAADTAPCDQWIYESRDTIVAEFGLACQEWKRTMVGTVHNAGMLVSLPIFGFISDKWGRKSALSLSASLVGVVGTLKAFSISYEMYVLVEFLETVAGSSVFPAAYILTIELLGQDKRVLTTVFLGITLVLGGISFALSAQALPYWRTWILVAYPPSILFASYFFIMPESIRWLMTKGQKEQAVKLIMKAAKINNVTLSTDILRKLKEEKDVAVVEKNQIQAEKSTSLTRQVLRSPVILTRLLICSFWWITCTFVFYGLAINSVSLAGDKYTNYILVVSVEIISVVTNALILDRIGRKKTLMGAYMTCGLSCIVIAFVPKSVPWLTTMLFLLGKVTITMAFSAIYMYTSELFPTHARHSLLGFCSMVGRVGSIVAPQTPLLAIYMESLPSMMFGATAVVSALLMTLTPETLNTRLPDTIQEAEQLARTKHKRDVVPVEMEAKF